MIIAERLLEWYDAHGRHDLPWRRTRTAYTVWVSEVMLQQTQVATVIPYFERFIARFPDLSTLAAAPLDDVLHHWSGLGYYSRARNLHRAARSLLQDHAGRFPADLDAVRALPGIGRSTAGAILALAFGARHPILDGNVKRVLARVHAIEGWPGESAVARRLWELAADHTPSARVDDYTQAIMDLGATLCTRTRPECERCPLQRDCAAFASGTIQRHPAARPRRALPRRNTRFLLLERGDGGLLLQRRPPTGIWGGLWGFPELATGEDPREWCRARGYASTTARPLPPLRHGFTHFTLDIEPLHMRVEETGTALMDSAEWLWYNAAQPARIGLAKPVRLLIEGLPRARPPATTQE